MPIFRVEKTKDYTVMCNYHLRDINLSLKDKGLLSMVLSLPQDWDYSIKGLTTICKEKETAITNCLNTLKKYGYLEVNKLLPGETKSGRIEYEYVFYEVPKKQDLENLGLEIQDLENPVQLNTNILNTEYKEGKKDIKINNIKKGNNFKNLELVEEATQKYDEVLKEKDIFIEREFTTLLSDDEYHKTALFQHAIIYLLEEKSQFINKIDCNILEKVYNNFLSRKKVEEIVHDLEYFVTALENEVIKQRGVYKC